jgi:peptidylprolyl isomerase
MKKRIFFATSVFCASFVLVGCQQEELSTTPISQRAEQAQSSIEKIVTAPDRVQQKIDTAVNEQNEKNETAKEIIEDTTVQDQSDNQINGTTMENIPQEINMEFAQTCKGATLVTNKGDVTIRFYGDDAPVTVANFCTLADKGYYEGVIFHRVIKGFMVQGGDPTGTGTGGPGYMFDDEIHANNKNMIGTIAMANAGPGTNGSQFFINVSDNNFLDTKHTVFGEVTNGMEIVAEIENVETGANDKPKEDVVIESVSLQM